MTLMNGEHAVSDRCRRSDRVALW